MAISYKLAANIRRFYNMKLTLTKVLVIAFSIIGALILFLVIFGEARQPDTFLNDTVKSIFGVALTPETPMNDTLSKVLLGILVATNIGVLLFLLAYKEPEPQIVEKTRRPETVAAGQPMRTQTQPFQQQTQPDQQQKKKRRR